MTGPKITARGKIRYNALIYAAENGHLGVVKLLLEHGAKADVKDQYSNSALSLASFAGHNEIALLLVDHGGKIRGEQVDRERYIS